jgi:hypothetical protein
MLNAELFATSTKRGQQVFMAPSQHILLGNLVVTEVWKGTQKIKVVFLCSKLEEPEAPVTLTHLGPNST